MLMIMMMITIPALQFILLLITTMSFLLYLAYSFSFKKPNQIPSPPWRLPLIGNLHQLSSRHHSLRSLAEKYGDVMLLHLGTVPTIIVSSAAAAQDVIKSHDLAFASRPSSTLLNKLVYNCAGASFSKYGEHWRQVRRIYTLHLLSPKKVNSFVPMIKEEVALAMDKIAAMGDELVNVSEIVVGLTSNIICRVAFGKRYSAEDGGGSRFHALFSEFNALVGCFAVKDYIQCLSWIDRLSGLDERVRKLTIELNGFLEKVIQEHENKSRDLVENEDFVDALLSLKDAKNDDNISITRETIKAFTLEIFTGGTDTTHSVIEWTMAELLKHPEKMKIVQEEVRSIIEANEKIELEMIQGMKYLKAAIKEALRLHPPLPLLLPRESLKDSQVRGCKIPAGTTVFINAWAIGRDPRSWDKPDEFLPERFLNSSIDFRGFDSKLIPFGAGRRGCPGMEFGVAVVELAIANLLYHFDWELPDGKAAEALDMTESVGVVSSKESCLILKVKKRNSNNNEEDN